MAMTMQHSLLVLGLLAVTVSPDTNTDANNLGPGMLSNKNINLIYLIAL